MFIYFIYILIICVYAFNFNAHYFRNDAEIGKLTKNFSLKKKKQLPPLVIAFRLILIGVQSVR